MANVKAGYSELVVDGVISADAAQAAVVAQLAALQERLESRPTGIFASVFRKPDVMRGLYIWGGVGRGKSMLMDLFFECVDVKRKRRVHFHGFMQEVHEAIHEARKSGVSDPIIPVAEGIAASARLLCFDEMQINDITDAMIVGRLFEQLFEAGVTVVVTSNRAPDGLYENGLNRQLFVPFIRLIEARMEVLELASIKDYRQEFLQGRQTYFAIGDAEFDRLWGELMGEDVAPLKLTVKSREVVLKQFSNGIARATFDELCGSALGAADYLAISEAVRVLFFEDIPQMSRAKNNEAKRFVTLIDTLYEAQVRLICTAATKPETLYLDGAGSFEFERTASRLIEMQGADWGSAKAF